MAYNISIERPGSYQHLLMAQDRWAEDYGSLFKQDRDRYYDIALKSRLSKGMSQAEAKAEASRIADSKVKRNISDDILKNQGKYVSQLKWTSMSDKEKQEHTDATQRKSNPYSFSSDKIQYAIRRMEAEDALRGAKGMRGRQQAQMRLDLLDAQEQEFRQQYNASKLSGRQKSSMNPKFAPDIKRQTLMKEMGQREDIANAEAEQKRLWLHQMGVKVGGGNLPPRVPMNPQQMQSILINLDDKDKGRIWRQWELNRQKVQDAWGGNNPYAQQSQARSKANQRFGQELNQRQAQDLARTNPQRYKQYTSFYKAAGGKGLPYTSIY